MKTKRAFLVKPGQFEISEVEVSPGPGEVLVKVSGCGLCNWELNHWRGLIGSCPQSLGHEWSGTVAETGPGVEGLKPGDVITALPDRLTGFSEYAVIDQKNCFKLDSGTDPLYVLGEPLKCIITVLRAAAPEAGDCGIIAGCGPMGLWCVQALSGKYLSALIAIDIDDAKLELAEEFGATHRINAGIGNAVGQIERITGGHMADFVIEGTGSPGLLNTAVSYLRPSGRGRLVLMSSHERASKEFDFREAVQKSIEIRVPHPKYSRDQAEDMRRAAALINEGVFNMDRIITHRFKLENIQTAFETLERKPEGYIKGIVIP